MIGWALPPKELNTKQLGVLTLIGIFKHLIEPLNDQERNDILELHAKCLKEGDLQACKILEILLDG